MTAWATGDSDSGHRHLAGMVAAGVGLLVLALLPLTLAGRVGSARGPEGALTAGPGRPAEPGEPVRIRIPAIGVDATLVRLGLNPDGTLEVPAYEHAGWYGGGAKPGSTGPAVIAAHLDSTTGPAVFYGLGKLKPRDEVLVDYADSTVSFRVRDSATFAKSQFPTRDVYGPTDAPELRLVTCDGAFDRRRGSYAANLVVWADFEPPAASAPPPAPSRSAHPAQIGSSG